MKPYNNTPSQQVKVAAVQTGSVFRDAPVWFDTAATVAKAVDRIREAASEGAQLVVFPEEFLPGFPYWGPDMTLDPGGNIGSDGTNMDLWTAYYYASIEVPGPEVQVLCQVARECRTTVVIGINERDAQYQGRMYNSVLYIGSDGRIIGTHRKIHPTVHERIFHTQGDGGDNLSVYDTEIGRLGGSICGEHLQLPLTYHWAMQGIQIHCSLWPGYRGNEELVQLITRSVCLTTQSFGVLSAAYFNDDELPKNFSTNDCFQRPGGFRGGSAIISPSGEIIAGPVYDEETIVYADVDLRECVTARHACNMAGIYSRWDILSLNVGEGKYSPYGPIDTNSQFAPEPSVIAQALEPQTSQQ